MRVLLLDMAGLIVSLLVGAVVIFFSSWFAVQNFFLLLAFLLIGVTITKYRHEEKREKGVYEHERSWQNVVSNAAFPMMCCVCFYFTGSPVWIAAYIGSIAGAMADKFASEIGVLSERPISLGTLKPVKQGTSGAISLLGTYLSFVGPLLIGIVGYVLYHYDPMAIFAVAIIGFIGSMADSIAGVFEEKGIGTKGTSNIICTIVSGLLALFMLKF